jgi:ribonuclease HII
MSPKKRFDPACLPERPDLSFETDLWQAGCVFVGGIDEAGRGALAGPVAAGAVILPSDDPDLFQKLEGVRDSKEMLPEARLFWADEIKKRAAAWGVGFAVAKEIDSIGIVPATCLAAGRALEACKLQVDHLLVDYLSLPNVSVPQTSLVKGDARSLSIACASILAKVSRDQLMIAMEATFPGYGFAQHKGYGTAHHRRALSQLGPCEQHRRTFAPVARFYALFPPEETTETG